jgi:hypothetical protein
MTYQGREQLILTSLFFTPAWTAQGWKNFDERNDHSHSGVTWTVLSTSDPDGKQLQDWTILKSYDCW